MYHIFISGYRLVEADHGKSFYVYTIERRAGLEHYITKMLQLSETKQQVLEFLGIESRHHPVITFAYDPYVNPDNNSSLPDIVIQGVLDGIYNP
ncbi:Protein of unknown function [Cotesia congregata]|uniref:Uncharacterized protein n=1 Tax=Cotesia congregata TaxID=51543 RepID=A0A8J2HGW9_COTCN|nr:Protein of unknown function [Cotesia congregata]